ncbi:MAG: hypothetical protein FWC59_02810, partial [Actinomycetia bacterium]|nr:hypothetical protein [Actinomycetes bacterium]
MSAAVASSAIGASRGALSQPSRGGQASSLAGLGSMLRFRLRYNWFRLMIWTILTVGMTTFVAAYYAHLAQTSSDFATQFEGLLSNPSMLAMLGSISAIGTADAPLGALVWMKLWMFTVLMLGIGMVFLVTHNMRADEDEDRTELFRSRPLGLHSSMMATVLMTMLFCLVVGVLIALIGYGLNLHIGTQQNTEFATLGNWVFGLSITVVGWLGIGIGVLFNELAPTSSSANTYGTATFGLFYLIRMAADMQATTADDGSIVSSPAIWASPIGWAQKMDPWGDNLLWPVVATLGVVLVCVLISWLIANRRDYSGALIPQRLGKANAGRGMTSVWGLAIRLQRASFISWAVGVVVFGLIFGTVVKQFADMIEGLGLGGLAAMGTDPMMVVVAIFCCFMALATCAFTIQSASTLYLDDSHGLLEVQLAGGVSRWSWALQRLLVTVLGTVLLLFLGGLTFGVSTAAVLDNDWSYVGTILGAIFIHFPSMMVFMGIVVFCFGFFPRLSIPLGWIAEGGAWFAMIVL